MKRPSRHTGYWIAHVKEQWILPDRVGYICPYKPTLISESSALHAVFTQSMADWKENAFHRIVSITAVSHTSFHYFYVWTFLVRSTGSCMTSDSLYPSHHRPPALTLQYLSNPSNNMSVCVTSAGWLWGNLWLWLHSQVRGDPFTALSHVTAVCARQRTNICCRGWKSNLQWGKAMLEEGGKEWKRNLLLYEEAVCSGAARLIQTVNSCLSHFIGSTSLPRRQSWQP